MDGSNMRPPSKLQGFWTGTKRFAGWMRRDFAEWFVGSWALIIGWTVFALIFCNFLIMDGTFSPGLGEGSAVNPDRFQQVGWAYRIFAALFMMLAMKLINMGQTRYAWAIRAIGCAITLIVILHATGFGLKALEGKRDGAESVVAVAEAKTETNSAQL